MTGPVMEEFEVTSNPPPRITELDPFRNPSADDVTVTVSGQDFDSGCEIYLLTSGPPIPFTATYITEFQVTFFIPGGTLTQDIYPVMIVNPDGQSDIYYYYGATPSAEAHLEDFDEILTGSLLTGRWRHDAIEGFDDWEGSYIYVAGGIDAGGFVLDDVEIIPVTLDGEAGAPAVAEQWFGVGNPRDYNLLNTERQGLAMARHETFVYAIGGHQDNTSAASSSNEALDTIEVAQILGEDTRPTITSADVIGPIGLPLGTWYYQVSALGTWGESLPSMLRMVWQESGTIRIEWDPVPGASGYNVYRNINPLGDGGATVLYATEVTDTYFEDDDTLVPVAGPIAPLPPGSLSLWDVNSNTLSSGREGLDALRLIVADPPESKAFLYVVGGRQYGDGTGYLASGEYGEILSDGKVLATNPLTNNLGTQRAFYNLLTNQGQNSYVGPGSDSAIFDPDEMLYLMAIVGDDSYDESGPGNEGIDTFEVCEVPPGTGDNTPWILQDAVLNKDNHGADALLFFDVVFIFPGVKTEKITENPSVHGGTPSRYLYYEGGDLGNPARVIWTSQSTAGSFDIARAYYPMLRLNGWVFVLGGNDGAGPLTSIERTEQ
jgi:hypothetical protein